MNIKKVVEVCKHRFIWHLHYCHKCEYYKKCVSDIKENYQGTRLKKKDK